MSIGGNLPLDEVIGAYESLKNFKMKESSYDSATGKYVQKNLDSKKAIFKGSWRIQKEEGLKPIAKKAITVIGNVSLNAKDLDLKRATEVREKLNRLNSVIKNLETTNVIVEEFNKTKTPLTKSDEFPRYVNEKLIGRPQKLLDIAIQAVSDRITILESQNTNNTNSSIPRSTSKNLSRRANRSARVHITGDEWAKLQEKIGKSSLPEQEKNPVTQARSNTVGLKEIDEVTSKNEVPDDEFEEEPEIVDQDQRITRSTKIFFEHEKPIDTKSSPERPDSDKIIIKEIKDEGSLEESEEGERAGISSNHSMEKLESDNIIIIGGEKKIEQEKEEFKFDPQTYQIPFFHIPSESLSDKEKQKALITRRNIYREAHATDTDGNPNRLVQKMNKAYEAYKNASREVENITQRLRELQEQSQLSLSPSSSEEVLQFPVSSGPPPPPPSSSNGPPPLAPPPPASKIPPPPHLGEKKGLVIGAPPKWKLDQAKKAIETKTLIKDPEVELKLELSEQKEYLEEARSSIISMLFGDEVKDSSKIFDSLNKEELDSLVDRYLTEAKECAEMRLDQWQVAAEGTGKSSGLGNKFKKTITLNEEEKNYFRFINSQKNELNTKKNNFIDFSNSLNTKIEKINELNAKVKAQSITSEERKALKKLTESYETELEEKQKKLKELVGLANKFQSSSGLPNPETIKEDASDGNMFEFVLRTLSKANELTTQINSNQAQELANRYAEDNKKTVKSKVVIGSKKGNSQPGIDNQKSMMDEIKSEPFAKLKHVTPPIERHGELSRGKPKPMKLDDE